MLTDVRSVENRNLQLFWHSTLDDSARGWQIRCWTSPVVYTFSLRWTIIIPTIAFPSGRGTTLHIGRRLRHRDAAGRGDDNAQILLTSDGQSCREDLLGVARSLQRRCTRWRERPVQAEANAAVAAVRASGQHWTVRAAADLHRLLFPANAVGATTQPPGLQFKMIDGDDQPTPTPTATCAVLLSRSTHTHAQWIVND